MIYFTKKELIVLIKIIKSLVGDIYYVALNPDAPNIDVSNKAIFASLVFALLFAINIINYFLFDTEVNFLWLWLFLGVTVFDSIAIHFTKEQEW